MQAGGNNVTGATVTVNGDVLTVTNLARLDQTDPSCMAWRRARGVGKGRRPVVAAHSPDPRGLAEMRAVGHRIGAQFFLVSDPRISLSCY
jgi:hypothetical protein